EAAAGIRSLITLDDPIGKTTLARELDDGLKLYRVTCPIGVIGVIFESRPDALVQIASLCLKSGNSVLLKGGAEAAETNAVLSDIIIKAAASIDNPIPDGWLKLLTSREDVLEMLKLDQYIGMIIPRGSNQFVKYIMDNTSIPVLGHADGVCHTFVDRYADLEMALKVIKDAKTQYVAVCNATETVLVDNSVAGKFLPELKSAMDRLGVKLYGCEQSAALIGIERAENWHTEYLDYKMSVRVVGGVDEAIEHINTFGSGHTDAIITMNRESAERFLRGVDSGNVFWNCSTRFSDGFRYGFGAEVGISTSKLHARGPVGLEGLMSYKYVIYGNGDIVGDYSSGKKAFKHKDINENCDLYKN
ncbi:MAG TPA: glutamate-5-semialdehyde dehydrogenase, partial [Clostridia bacterium]|nr:glutamate-5-semialdehyde dehydrogenase [Clostridia bacterium]